MTTKTSILKPGLLVSLKSTVAGGVTYQRVDLEAKSADGDQDVARWETTRVIEDKEEHDRAVKARSKALSEIRKECSATAFGLLCPQAAEGALDAAIARARGIVDEHNRSATHTHVQIYALKGQIATTDTEAARAIGQEVAELVAAMSQGIDKLDPEAIREAANRARAMSGLLDESTEAKVSEAIKQARSAARSIVKRVQKDGEAAAIVLADVQRGALEKARIAFLDLDGGASEPVEHVPAVEAQRFADLASEVA